MLKDVHDKTNFCYHEEIEGCSKRTNFMEYAKVLSEEAEIKGMPPVLFSMMVDTVKIHLEDPHGFRNYKYTIIDDETFRKEKI